jgi:hypothetical protein
MISFTQINDYPVWRSIMDISDVDLSTESIIGPSNRNGKYLPSITNPNTIRLANYLRSLEFKNTLIQTLKTYKNTSRMYPKNILENLCEYTNLVFDFYRQNLDTHLPHLDYRTSVAQGLIYFDKIHTPHHSTKFYPFYPIKNIMLEGNTSIGNGLLMLNTETTWHEGGNTSTDDRNFLLYTLELKIGNK